MSSLPLVSIMIATKDRHEDLAFTLSDLCRQDYPALELLILDDASTPPVEPLVRKIWPEVRIVRYEQSAGQTTRRNEGFKLAHGEFILHLDDDCSPVDAGCIRRSVEIMQAESRAAAIAYYVFNGLTLPAALEKHTVAPGYCLSYTGAAGFLRKASVEQTAGYRERYFGYAEEEELGLQFLQNGMCVLFRPEMLAHHRFSNVNRNKEQSWKRALRNRLWTIVIHSPWNALPLEAGWKIGNGLWDALRLGRLRLFFAAMGEMFAGMSAALAVRDPLKPMPKLRYDALRLFGTLTREQFDDPPKRGLKDTMRWARNWPNQLREGSRWSKKKNVGRAGLPMHEHEVTR